MVQNILDFFLTCWNWAEQLEVHIDNFTFSLADILITEIEVAIICVIINLLWHLGVYNTGSD